MILICFTPTNLAFLSCTAGVLGAVGRSLKLVDSGDRPPSDETHPLLSAVIRGLFVFLVVISGLLALLENPILGTASPGQYVRYAGLISLTSFVVNYDPSVFATLLDQVRERMEKGPEDTSSESGEESEASSGPPSSQ
jgi:hypothetical protein